MPVVLLALAGDCLVVSTAIFTDSMYADELLSIKLFFGSHASNNVLCVARIFMAINKCMEGLRGLYKDLKANPQKTPPAKVLWPNPTVNPSKSTKSIPKLEFFSKLDHFNGTPINKAVINEENKRHAMYLARMQPEGSDLVSVILVKFAIQYNKSAHCLLTKHCPDPSLAPRLYTRMSVISDMEMVVMEYIPASKGSSLEGSPKPFPARDVVHWDVSKALELLHRQGLIFGDLQELNILYLLEVDCALLIDFDGVGRDGVDWYPACLNPDVDLSVERLQIMDKSHDLENLEELMKQLSKQR